MEDSLLFSISSIKMYSEINLKQICDLTRIYISVYERKNWPSMLCRSKSKQFKYEVFFLYNHLCP